MRAGASPLVGFSAVFVRRSAAPRPCYRQQLGRVRPCAPRGGCPGGGRCLILARACSPASEERERFADLQPGCARAAVRSRSAVPEGCLRPAPLGSHRLCLQRGELKPVSGSASEPSEKLLESWSNIWMHFL